MTQFFSPRPDTSIAYQHLAGTAPGIFWCSGYRSDMTGSKAAFLAERCRARGQAFTAFDYTGHGQSSGKLEDGTIGSWLQDAVDVFDQLTTGPQIVVGSSMGGWISLMLAEQRAARVAALVTIAAAPDFSEEVYQSLSTEARAELDASGIYYLEAGHDTPHPFKTTFFEDGRQRLMLSRPIEYNGPVRLLHGKADDVVPWEKSLRIQQNLTSEDVSVTWIDDGDHRMARDSDLAVLDGLITSLQSQARDT